MNYDKFLGAKVGSECRELYAVLTTFNRRAELQRLVAWASQKHLENPLRLYQNRLEDEEKRLFHYAVASPRLTKFAYCMYQFNKLIGRPAHHFPRGSAAAYRTHYLTPGSKSHSIFSMIK